MRTVRSSDLRRSAAGYRIDQFLFDQVDKHLITGGAYVLYLFR